MKKVLAYMRVASRMQLTDRHISRQTVEQLRDIYPAGTRVELVSMDDPYRHLEPGLKGTVRAVDDMATIHIAWDNGSSLGAVYGVDTVRKM